MSVAWAKLL